MIEDITRVVSGLIRIVMGMAANSVRPADQLMPSGGQIKEFATVKVISARDDGHASSSLADVGDELSEQLDAVKVVMVSVNFFRSPTADAAGIAKYSRAAFDRAARLRQRLQLASAAALMRAAGVGLLKVGDARDLTAVVDDTYESRGQIDLTFSFVHRESADLHPILSAEVSLDLQTPGGDLQPRAFEVTP